MSTPTNQSFGCLPGSRNHCECISDLSFKSQKTWHSMGGGAMYMKRSHLQMQFDFVVLQYSPGHHASEFPIDQTTTSLTTNTQLTSSTVFLGAHCCGYYRRGLRHCQTASRAWIFAKYHAICKNERKTTDRKHQEVRSPGHQCKVSSSSRDWFGGGSRQACVNRIHPLGQREKIQPNKSTIIHGALWEKTCLPETIHQVFAAWYS